MEKIGFLGPRGTFSHEFALKVSAGAMVIPIEGEFSELLKDALEHGCDGAVLPFLNSSGVQVRPAQKAVFDSAGKWWVIGAEGHPVVHNLVVTQAFERLERITSKMEVFPQCREWLDANAQGIERVEAKSTASALKDLMASPADVQKVTGVICNRLATTIHGGETKEEGIQDPNNQTVFLVLSTRRPSFSERVLITIDCPNQNCYEGTVDRFAIRSCPMKFSSLIGDFSPAAPTFVEVEIANAIDHEELIQSECNKMNSVVRLVGTYTAVKSISNCISNLFD